MPPQISDDGIDSDDGLDVVPARASSSALKDEEIHVADDNEGDDDEDAEDEYRVEAILKHKEQGGRVLYLIKWEGWDKVSDQTWEPIDNLGNATEILEEYHQQIGGPPEPKSVKKRGPKPKRSNSEAFQSPSANGNGTASKRSRKSEANGSSGLVDLPEGSWEDHVVRINSILEESEVIGPDKATKTTKLVGLVEWKEGRKTQHSMAVLRRKAPQKLLDYYEQHLVFRGSSES